jgi:hypothetical protein
MTDKEIIKTSKFLSVVLRHEPERVGLKLDEAGWVGVEELLHAVNRNGVALTLDLLQHIVATNDKKRFAFSEDGRCIRANRGHSVEVNLPARAPNRSPLSPATDLVEALAELEHEQWMHWSGAVESDVAEPRRTQWRRCRVRYAELTDELKEADRVWARKVLALLRQRNVIP